MSDSESSEEALIPEQEDGLDERRFGEAFAKNDYSYALEGSSELTNDAALVAHSTHWFPYLKMEAIIFPEQHSPHVLGALDRFKKVWESANANGFVVCISRSIQARHRLPYVATVCKVLRVQQLTLGIELLGTRRCNVLEINRRTDEAKVEILPEVEHAQLLPRMLPKYAKSSSPYAQRELAFRITGYPVNLTRDITLRNVEKIVASLGSLIPIEKVRSALGIGLAHFSYYVARNIFSNQEVEYKILKENSVDTRIALAVEYCKSVWAKCNECSTPIFAQKSVLPPDDSSIIHVNEHGYVHKITLVSKLENFERVTYPSMQFTWFPTYSWTIIQCSQCQNHIGWEYESETHRPRRFYGVRREGVTFTRINENDDDDVIIKSEDGEGMES